MTHEEKLRQLGLDPGPVPAPAANYLPAVRTGSLVFTSGNGPIRDGQVVCRGQLGGEVTVEQGYEAARLTALNLLAVLREHLGTLDRVVRVVKVTGYVNSAAGFSSQPQVVNGASDLLAAVFGEAGRHARCAIGVAALPRGMAVELDMVVEVRDLPEERGR